MYYQNVRGLRTELVDLRLSLITLSSQYDIIVLTETCLDDTYNSAELGFENFSVYRCDRSSNTSLAVRIGGVLVAVRDGLSSSMISVERSNIEQLFVYMVPLATLWQLCTFRLGLRPSSTRTIFMLSSMRHLVTRELMFCSSVVITYRTSTEEATTSASHTWRDRARLLARSRQHQSS